MPGAPRGCCACAGATRPPASSCRRLTTYLAAATRQHAAATGPARRGPPQERTPRGQSSERARIGAARAPPRSAGSLSPRPSPDRRIEASGLGIARFGSGPPRPLPGLPPVSPSPSLSLSSLSSPALVCLGRLEVSHGRWFPLWAAPRLFFFLTLSPPLFA
jgi:hypothetical protein